MGRKSTVSPFLVLMAVAIMTNANATDDEFLITDFTAATADLGWYVVNDNVMGGRSDGDFVLQDGELHFSGRTNTRGGGFSSIRADRMELDLSDYAGIRLRVMGDGRRYTWRLATDARWRGREISYWADFDTVSGEWVTVDLPFSRFVAKFRGRHLDGPALDTAKIGGMGLMIYDGNDGPFELRLKAVHSYSESTPFSLSRYRWKNRVLVVSAGSENDVDLRRQINDMTSTRADFDDRDMALIVLVDDGRSSAGERPLTDAEVDATRAALGIRPGGFAVRLIGTDGSVKLARETPTPMSEIYALIDTMPMRRQEQSGP